jgi:hypothetical protein
LLERPLLERELEALAFEPLEFDRFELERFDPAGLDRALELLAWAMLFPFLKIVRGSDVYPAVPPLNNDLLAGGKAVIAARVAAGRTPCAAPTAPFPDVSGATGTVELPTALRTISTFSCDIAYASSPAASWESTGGGLGSRLARDASQ